MARNQVEMFTSLEGLVSQDHPYRRFEALVDFDALARPLRALYSDRGRPELGAARSFRMLVLQFVEDLSDREMERFMRENLAGKWFCGSVVLGSVTERLTIPSSGTSGSGWGQSG